MTNSSVTLGTVNNPYGKYSTVNISSDSGSNYPVKYGTSASSLAYSATGNVTTYAQIYTGNPYGLFLTIHIKPAEPVLHPAYAGTILTGLDCNGCIHLVFILTVVFS